MPNPQYVADTEGAAVALVAATAKTVVGVKAHANSGLLLCGFVVSTDGIVSGRVSGLIEVNYCTWATKSPGTNSDSTTPRQVNGRVLAAGFTSGKNWAAANEPTVQTHVFPEFRLTPFGGTFAYNFPLGFEPDSALAEGFCIRCTFADVVNITAGLIVTRA